MMSITVDVKTYPEALSTGILDIDGQDFDIEKGVQKVMIVGPVDERTCLMCLNYVGMVFNADSPEIQAFYGEGLHPNCRHFVEPVLAQGEALPFEPVQSLDENLQKLTDKELVSVMGKEKSELYKTGAITSDDLLREDGTIRPLREMKKKPKPGA